MNVENSDHVMG